MIGDHRRREESGHLEPAVTVRRTHHGNLDAHVAQSSDAICPVSFDWGATLDLEAKFGEELNGGIDVFYHDADVVHTFDRHDVSLASNVGGQPRAAPARPGFLPEDAARLVGWSALFGSPPFPRTALVVLSTPRSASLTASSEGKAAATSGSSKTKLLPLRSRATYLPRTPPFIDAKSYSGRRSLSLCRFALFIELSLAPRRSTGADDADGVGSLRVGHNQDVSPRGCADCQETGLRL